MGDRLSAFFMLMLAVHAKARNDSNTHLTGPYFQRRRPIARNVLIAAPVLALILSVAATYAAPERPALWQMTILIAQFGSALFPVVGKFATHMIPPLAPIILYKAQSVVTLSMLAGCAVTIATISLAPFHAEQ